jgi:hypothetical protein
MMYLLRLSPYTNIKHEFRCASCPFLHTSVASVPHAPAKSATARIRTEEESTRL